MSDKRSYKINEFTTNVGAEIERLKAQVELFWNVEKKYYENYGLKNEQKILECGSGPGFLVALLAKNYPDATVYSLEIDPVLVVKQKEYIQNEHLNNVTIYEGSVTDNSLPQDYFDTIIVRLVLEHLPDPLDALNEMKKLLKIGGRIIVIDNDFDFHLRTYPDIPELETMYKAYCRLRTDEGGHPKIGRELPILLRNAGFTERKFAVIPVNSESSGDEIFIKSENAGISNVLVRKGYLSAEDFDSLSINWSNLIRSENHLFFRQLFIASGTRSAGINLEEITKKKENKKSYTDFPISKEQIYNSENDERSALLTKYITFLLTETLELEENIYIRPDESLLSIGLDSISGVIINEKIERSLGIAIGISRLLEADSILAISEIILNRLVNDNSLSDEYEEGEI